MKYYNALGLIGFILSGIAAALGASIILSLVAIFPWGISVVIRGIAWISLSRINPASQLLYLSTGISVIVLGLLSIGSLIVMIRYISSINAETLNVFFIPALFWMIYSLSEFLSYIKTEGKWFKIASINILSIVIFLILTVPLPKLNFTLANIGGTLVIASFIIMIISAIFAAIGFAKITPRTN